LRTYARKRCDDRGMAAGSNALGRDLGALETSDTLKIVFLEMSPNFGGFSR
jgi:hypothetical protein